jgi:DNA-binding transcriptional MocR family regulator
MVAALKELMPEDVRFTQPQGGLFLWVELAEGENAGHLLAQCMSRKVAFIPGAAFYPNGGNEHTLRLSFSVTNETQIREGIRRLAEVIKQERGTGSFLTAPK